MPVMPKYICKVSHHHGQFRITIPKLLVEEVGWEDVEFIIPERLGQDEIWIRRFVNGESLKSNHSNDSAGSD